MAKSQLAAAFRAVNNAVPGAITDCVWARVTASDYDPATGQPVLTTTTETFTGIRSEYRLRDRANGVQAGDFQLIVDSVSLTTLPPIDAVIVCNGVSCTVVDSKDYAGMAYDLQMRAR